jgi:ATP/maltotriose-dependent transcriptional regulator MalT/DNA-binding SARP family transcriptional activator
MGQPDSQKKTTPAKGAGDREGSIPKHKISPPRLNPHVFFRENLLKYLDDQLNKGSVWITGPPGSGKTVLASSYLHSRKIPSFWYQLDIIDSDPASFFSLFPRALAFQEERKPLLPGFTPETMLQLQVFSRKFFRELFRACREPAIIVLDNYQDIEEESPVHTIIALMVEELPPESRLVFLSRSRPLQPFARSRANNSLHVVEGERLLFSRDEIGALLQLQGIGGGRDGLDDYLHDVTQGWAAGLTLMLEELDTQDGQAFEPYHYDVVFDYFADVVFQRQGKEEQEMLLKASVLQELDVKVVEALCRWSGAGPYLRELSQKNYFTYRMSKGREIYQIHPLFREFLAKSAEERFPGPTLLALRRQGAELLRESGQIIESIELLFKSGDWTRCASLIKENAPYVFRKAHFGTVLRWLSGMPGEMVECDPWLLCHKGVAAMPFLPQVSIECLRKSFQKFVSNRDFSGALFCCPFLIRAILSFMADMSVMDPLIDFIQQQVDVKELERQNDPQNDQLALGMFRALVSRRPDDPEIELWGALVEKLFQKGRLMPGPVLPLHYLWTGRFEEAESALNRSLAMKKHMDSSALDLTGVLSLKLQYHLMTGQTARCLETMKQGLKIVEETGVKIWKNHYFLLGAACCLNGGEKIRAEKFIGEVEKNLPELRGLDLSYYHLVKAFFFLLKGEKKQAEYHGNRALEVGIGLGMPSYENWCRLGTGLLAVDRQDYDGALEHFDRIFQLCSRSRNPWFACQAHLGMALVHLGLDQKDEAIERAQEGFSLANRHGYSAFFFFPKEMMTELCILAQQETIETGFVCSFIRRWKIIPKALCARPELWPWPVRIFALGEFRVDLNEESLISSLGRQGKPLELLRVLVSLGGNQVAETRVQDILWPDSEGDNQSRSLKTTLHRLRKLLGVKEAIVHKNKALSINPACCWLDILAFKELVEKVADAVRKENADQVIELARNALDLYRGPFLSDRSDEDWTFAPRSDFTHQFRSLVECVGNLLEEKKGWASADRIYQEAISKDPVCEIYCQRRMVCLSNMGNANLALRVYDECRERLERLLGEKPSPQTTHLRDQILSS